MPILTNQRQKFPLLADYPQHYPMAEYTLHYQMSRLDIWAHHQNFQYLVSFEQMREHPLSQRAQFVS